MARRSGFRGGKKGVEAGWKDAMGMEWVFRGATK
jgi:hypothetical protein